MWEMMGFLGMGNNPMVGATVAVAVAVAERPQIIRIFLTTQTGPQGPRGLRSVIKAIPCSSILWAWSINFCARPSVPARYALTPPQGRGGIPPSSAAWREKTGRVWPLTSSRRWSRPGPSGTGRACGRRCILDSHANMARYVQAGDGGLRGVQLRPPARRGPEDHDPLGEFPCRHHARDSLLCPGGVMAIALYYGGENGYTEAGRGAGPSGDTGPEALHRSDAVGQSPGRAPPILVWKED